MGFFLYPSDVVLGASIAFLFGTFAAGEGWNIFWLLLVFVGIALGAVFICRDTWKDFALFILAFGIGAIYFHMPLPNLFGWSGFAWLLQELASFKLAIIGEFQKVLPADQAALLGGMTVGGTTGMSAGLKREMSASGTTYITGMYGYKIGVIVFALKKALLGVIPRKWSITLIVALVAAFVLMAGAEATVVRAGIMGIVVLFSEESGQIFATKNVLVFTALVMTIFDPTLPSQNIGFQLSFLSLVGIVYLGPPIAKFLRSDKESFLDWKEHAMLATASNLPILPLVMSAFGSFPLTAFVSNILVSIPVGVLMSLGSGIAGAYPVNSFLASLIAKVAMPVMWYELAVIKFFSEITLPMPAFFISPLMMIIYYIILIAIMFFYERD